MRGHSNSVKLNLRIQNKPGLTDILAANVVALKHETFRRNCIVAVEMGVFGFNEL